MLHITSLSPLLTQAFVARRTRPSHTVCSPGSTGCFHPQPQPCFQCMSSTLSLLKATQDLLLLTVKSNFLSGPTVQGGWPATCPASSPAALICTCLREQAGNILSSCQPFCLEHLHRNSLSPSSFVPLLKHSLSTGLFLSNFSRVLPRLSDPLQTPHLVST